MLCGKTITPTCVLPYKKNRVCELITRKITVKLLPPFRDVCQYNETESNIGALVWYKFRPKRPKMMQAEGKKCQMNHVTKTHRKVRGGGGQKRTIQASMLEFTPS